MPTIEAGGLHVHYTVDGEGPPLILLHGASSDGQAQFADLLPALAPGWRVYAPDARGHGGTRWDPAAGFSTPALAADVLAFADALGLETFHLFGYSMGGMSALHVASLARERLRSLVVVSVSPEREPRLAVVRSFLDPERIERADPTWAAWLARQHDPVQGPGAWRRLLPAVIADVEQQPLLSAAALREIDTLTLVVAGDRDPLVPVDQAWRLSRQLRDARLLILPGVGHDVMGEGRTLLEHALPPFYATIDLTEVPR